MSFKISSMLSFTFSQFSEPKTIEKIISPELKEKINKRADIKLKVDTHALKVIIKARDLTVFRSIINTYIRWLTVIEKIKKLVGGIYE